MEKSQEIIDFVPSQNEINDYFNNLNRLKKEIDLLIYESIALPKEKFEVNYNIGELKYTKLDPEKFKPYNVFWYADQFVLGNFDKFYNLKVDLDNNPINVDKIEWDLIENNLIKVSKWKKFKHWLIKNWYRIQFVYFYIKYVIKKRYESFKKLFIRRNDC